MPYSTVDDMKKMLPEETIVQLTDDEGAGSLNEARAEEAISQADAEIDSYLGGRYSVPLGAAPAIVRKLSVDIAIYNLYSRLASEVPAARAERYRSAVRQLEAISAGRASLGVEPAPAASRDGRSETNRAGGENVFTRESLKGF